MRILSNVKIEKRYELIALSQESFLSVIKFIAINVNILPILTIQLIHSRRYCNCNTQT